MKTIKTNATANKTSSEIDLFEGISLSLEAKRRVAEEAGELLIDSILKDVGGAKSPVSGDRFPRLSKSYKKFKESQNLGGSANLEFTGDMLDNLSFNVSRSGKLEIGVFGQEAHKADGHNNFSGDSTLPLRQFLPKEQQVYRQGIKSQIDSILREAIAKNIKLPVRKLQAVETKEQFFTVMSEIFPNVSRAKIVEALLSDEQVIRSITDLGLIRFIDGS